VRKKGPNAWRRACFNKPRKSRSGVGTSGSRNHKTSGSVKSTGLAIPWCSVRCTAVSSR